MGQYRLFSYWIFFSPKIHENERTRRQFGCHGCSVHHVPCWRTVTHHDDGCEGGVVSRCMKREEPRDRNTTTDVSNNKMYEDCEDRGKYEGGKGG
jgi:hypothetical protein